jgi:hypothetical protein
METLKRKAAEKSVMDISDTNLVYSGKIISGDDKLKKTVSEIGLMNNSTIFIIFRLKGGEINDYLKH